LIEARRLALTSLDLEHTALLGDTLEAIAREKIDAAPANARLFAPESIAARPTIEERCRERGVTLEFVAPLAEAPLPGEHQRANAALAVRLARDMTVITDAHMSAGLAATQWPGRLEIIERDPLIVIDVGHTPDAVRQALDGFTAMCGSRRGILVCGVSEDKNASELLAILAPAFDAIVCAAAHKGALAAQIAALAAAANPTAEIAIAESVADARQLALTKAKSAETAIYVAGSLFLATEFKALHPGRDPSSLAFF
jgi:dihydrofolate synthase/folylpolyglutamate synthase